MNIFDIQFSGLDNANDSMNGSSYPMEPASPFVKSSAASFTNSPLSPVHTLVNSPYMVSKVCRLCRLSAGDISWGYFLETKPDQIAMVIRVELFIHKPCQAEDSCGIHCNTPGPPSHLFGISRNQAEPAGMSRSDVGMDIFIYFLIFLDMWFGGVLNYVRTHSLANQDVPTRLSKDSDNFWIAFQLKSFDIEIDSGSNQNAFEVHSGSFEAHSGHSGRILGGFFFNSPSKAIRMFRMLLECRNGP